MHRMEDAVLQPKKITYTDCVICFFAQVGVKTGTGNFLARKRHKNAEKYVVNLWTRGGVLDRILTIYNVNNPCVTADVSFSAKDKPVVLEFIEPIFLYDYFIHSSKI